MQIKRRRRLILLSSLLIGLSSAVALALFALRQNINLYLTPDEVKTHHFSANQEFRLGGIVMPHSIHRRAHQQQIRFALTDHHQLIWVIYSGLLPSLFREGQGIIAQGKLQPNGVFVADQVLAKHDANYHPSGLTA